MENYKIVHFWEYCQKCKHENLDEDEEPCCDCLTYSVNVESHKPVCFKEKNNGR